jgi:pimeloyl-ACP methyl ester carboxylesterase
MKVHEVRGGGDARLHVREWGGADGRPILFVHGWSQCHLYWSRQIESSLAEEFRLVAFDLRGHGMSDAPLEEEHYTDADLWADDVQAIIDELGVDRPVLVGHSYGGYVICDYVRAHGQEEIGAIDFVGAATTATEEAFGTLIGPGFLDHFEGASTDDLPTNIGAIRGLLRDLPAKPLPREAFERALGWNMVVPARIRGNLFAREIDSDDVLQGLTVPVLVTHGRADTAVLPAMAEHVLEVCPTAEASWYDGVGHLSNLEEPERFNRELGELARSVP